MKIDAKEVIQSLKEVGIDVTESGAEDSVIELENGRTVKMKDLKFSDLFPMIPRPERRASPEPITPGRMNPSGIKVIRVTSWQVKFRYRGKTFLLHDESGDGESIVALYEFKADKFGSYTLEYIKSSYGFLYRTNFDTRRKTSTPYSQMDMGYFERYLNNLKFSTRIESYCDNAAEV